jgi:hypothetical protein
MNTRIGWLGSGAAMTSVITAAGHSVIAIIAVAVAAVLAVAIVTFGREWFLLCALRRPGRDLCLILKLTGNVREAKTLAALLAPSYAHVLTAHGRRSR